MSSYGDHYLCARLGVHITVTSASGAKFRILVEPRYIGDDQGEDTQVYYLVPDDNTETHSATLKEFSGHGQESFTYAQMLDKIPEQNRPKGGS